MAVASAIRTEGRTKRFGDVLALDGLDLVVERGEVRFLGPNGAGETTAIRLLLHLIHPNAGRAWVMDVPVDDVARTSTSVMSPAAAAGVVAFARRDLRGA